MNRTRTFVALPVSAAVKELAAEWMHRLGKTGVDVKWVAAENLHLTLKFLGEVPTIELAEICQRVTSAVANCEPLEMVFDHVGAFPSAERPRTLWMGVGAGQEAVFQVHEQVEQALMQMGFRGEHRQFHPHVTLGRLRSSLATAGALAEVLQAANFGPAVTCLASQVVVVASQLGRDEPQYQRLATIPLKKSGS
ncbi:MAG: RNA 2',3'-cyclic phosphodiesterase [Planctomycetota bacterium]|nr:RNA 2',3'-cyclic phosphodiesterase [Planctomycetota bacterium]